MCVYSVVAAGFEESTNGISSTERPFKSYKKFTLGLYVCLFVNTHVISGYLADMTDCRRPKNRSIHIAMTSAYFGLTLAARRCLLISIGETSHTHTHAQSSRFKASLQTKYYWFRWVTQVQRAISIKWGFDLINACKWNFCLLKSTNPADPTDRNDYCSVNAANERRITSYFSCHAICQWFRKTRCVRHAVGRISVTCVCRQIQRNWWTKFN